MAFISRQGHFIRISAFNPQSPPSSSGTLAMHYILPHSTSHSSIRIHFPHHHPHPPPSSAFHVQSSSIPQFLFKKEPKKIYFRTNLPINYPHFSFAANLRTPIRHLTIPATSASISRIFRIPSRILHSSSFIFPHHIRFPPRPHPGHAFPSIPHLHPQIYCILSLRAFSAFSIPQSAIIRTPPNPPQYFPSRIIPLQFPSRPHSPLSIYIISAHHFATTQSPGGNLRQVRQSNPAINHQHYFPHNHPHSASNPAPFSHQITIIFSSAIAPNSPQIIFPRNFPSAPPPFSPPHQSAFHLPDPHSATPFLLPFPHIPRINPQLFQIPRISASTAIISFFNINFQFPQIIIIRHSAPYPSATLPSRSIPPSPSPHHAFHHHHSGHFRPFAHSGHFRRYFLPGNQFTIPFYSPPNHPIRILPIILRHIPAHISIGHQ